jgi:hypothetical protein
MITAFAYLRGQSRWACAFHARRTTTSWQIAGYSSLIAVSVMKLAAYRMYKRIMHVQVFA